MPLKCLFRWQPLNHPEQKEMKEKRLWLVFVSEGKMKIFTCLLEGTGKYVRIWKLVGFATVEYSSNVMLSLMKWLFYYLLLLGDIILQISLERATIARFLHLVTLFTKEHGTSRRSCNAAASWWFINNKCTIPSCSGDGVICSVDDRFIDTMSMQVDIQMEINQSTRRGGENTHRIRKQVLGILLGKELS